jgi:hypothetical protein
LIIAKITATTLIIEITVGDVGTSKVIDRIKPVVVDTSPNIQPKMRFFLSFSPKIIFAKNVGIIRYENTSKTPARETEDVTTIPKVVKNKISLLKPERFFLLNIKLMMSIDI